MLDKVLDVIKVWLLFKSEIFTSLADEDISVIMERNRQACWIIQILRSNQFYG